MTDQNNTKAFKAHCDLYVSASVTVNNYAFYIYGSCMIHAVNSDYFLKWHPENDLYNGEVLCSRFITD
jgi:hypothetical protein